MLLVTLLSICSFTPMSIYGEVKNINVSDNKWAYFGFSFGDFGHTVGVHAYVNNTALDVYYSYGHNCPTENSTEITSKTTLFDHPSQSVVCGVKLTSSDPNVLVEVISAVRPIHSNSSNSLIYGFFIFFCLNFLIAGFLQFYYFRQSMDPREYLPQGE